MKGLLVDYDGRKGCLRRMISLLIDIVEVCCLRGKWRLRCPWNSKLMVQWLQYELTGVGWWPVGRGCCAKLETWDWKDVWSEKKRNRIICFIFNLSLPCFSSLRVIFCESKLVDNDGNNTKLHDNSIIFFHNIFCFIHTLLTMTIYSLIYSRFIEPILPTYFLRFLLLSFLLTFTTSITSFLFRNNQFIDLTATQCTAGKRCVQRAMYPQLFTYIY